MMVSVSGGCGNDNVDGGGGAVSCPPGLLSYEYFTGRGGSGGLPGGRDPAGRCRRPRLRGPGRSTRTYKLTLPGAVSGSTIRPPPLHRVLWTTQSLRATKIYYHDDLYIHNTLYTPIHIILYLYRICIYI